jgi:hypothetical protein
MTLRAFRFFLALSLAIAVGLLLTAVAATSDPADDQAPAAAAATKAEAAQAAAASAVAASDPAADPEDSIPDEQADTPDAMSPSQEAQAKINDIRRNEFFYQSYGKLDPFQPLVSGDYERLGGAELVDLASARLVGVMWGGDDQFALVEDPDGFGYILRVGDRVRNGRVVGIRKSSMSAKVTLYGITSTVVLKLEKTEG